MTRLRATPSRVLARCAALIGCILLVAGCSSSKSRTPGPQPETSASLPRVRAAEATPSAAPRTAQRGLVPRQGASSPGARGTSQQSPGRFGGEVEVGAMIVVGADAFYRSAGIPTDVPDQE